MGRGRAKAKQTKVARELKYHSPSTDFSRLQAELGHDGGPSFAATTPEPEVVEDDDPYAEYASYDEDDEDADEDADEDSVRTG